MKAKLNTKLKTKLKTSMPLTIMVSLLIHAVILFMLSRANTGVDPKPLAEKKKTVIKAKLAYLPKIIPIPKTEPKPPEVEKVEPEQKPKPEPKPKAKPKPKPKSEPEPAVEQKPPTASLQAAQPKALKQALKAPPSEKDKHKTLPPATTPQATFDPYASMGKLFEAQNEQYLDTVTFGETSPDSIKSINSSDEPVNKELFEGFSLDSKTKVVKYGKGCVQIERTKDYNGFEQNSWTGTSLPCGQDDDNKQQFKKSMDKFLRPKNKG